MVNRFFLDTHTPSFVPNHVGQRKMHVCACPYMLGRAPAPGARGTVYGSHLSRGLRVMGPGPRRTIVTQASFELSIACQWLHVVTSCMGPTQVYHLPNHIIIYIWWTCTIRGQSTPMVEDGAPDYERKEFFPLKVNHPMINASSDHPWHLRFETGLLANHVTQLHVQCHCNSPKA